MRKIAAVVLMSLSFSVMAESARTYELQLRVCRGEADIARSANKLIMSGEISKAEHEALIMEKLPERYQIITKAIDLYREAPEGRGWQEAFEYCMDVMRGYK